MKTPVSDDAAPASLPEIPLNELSETTKNFLIAHSAGGKSVPDVVREVLDQAATRAGFEPHKAA